MKKTVLAVLGVLVIAALLVVVPAVVAQTDLPAPVAAFNTAFNAGNVDTAAAAFTPDAVVTTLNGDSLFTPGLIRAWLQASANAKLTYTPVAGTVQTSGDTVTWQAKPSTGDTQKVTAKLANGKISNLTFAAAPAPAATGGAGTPAAGTAAGAASTPAAASAAAAATPVVGAASAANATPSALPTTGATDTGAGFPIIWAALGGLIIAGGLAMRYHRTRA
ncbi:MAG: nuclear transport factor 2 family protein [Anaerolineae bacterium]